LAHLFPDTVMTAKTDNGLESSLVLPRRDFLRMGVTAAVGAAAFSTASLIAAEDAAWAAMTQPERDKIMFERAAKLEAEMEYMRVHGMLDESEGETCDDCGEACDDCECGEQG